MFGNSMLMRRTGGAGPNIANLFATALYNEGVFNTTIVNGIDLAGLGGMVWLKRRDSASQHVIYDSLRGNDTLGTNLTTGNTSVPTFTRNSNGFTVPRLFTEGASMATWSFARAARFFDVVTYTGNANNDRDIAHSLGGLPGFIIIKRLDTTSPWTAWHRAAMDEGGGGFNGVSYAGGQANLNTTAVFNTAGSGSYSTTYQGYVNHVSTTTFRVTGGEDGITNVNANGGAYVAYLFAHDAAADGVVRCGSVAGLATATLGWQPQFLLLKSSASSGAWFMVDAARGLVSGSDNYLVANTTDAEVSGGIADVSSTGFTNASSDTMIYIAIRAAS